LGLDTDNGGEFINVELLAYCEQEQITFTRGRPKRSNDQCYVEQKNGHIVRQVVGYDRFAGEFAYRQLTELYRALRVYVNCFQPSMKLQTKQRERQKVHRRYDRAQTPMQRLLATESVSGKKRQELTQITQALDPLRLLQQLEQLQKALFRHTLPPGGEAEHNGASALQSFSARQCAEESVPYDGIPGTPPALLKKERKRRYHRSGRPHDWRTREDPFEGTWEDITNWLRVQSGLTAAEIFRQLQQLYPARFKTTQARTLRRGISKLRAHLLVTFDDQWDEEVAHGQLPVPALRAEVVAGMS
jgi:hypothetical protein